MNEEIFEPTDEDICVTFDEDLPLDEVLGADDLVDDKLPSVRFRYKREVTAVLMPHGFI